MPPSRMDGREPVEVTEYERDADGRIVRATTTREPLWTEQDTAEMLALTEYREGLCDCCGLPKAVTQVNERDAPRFVVSKTYCLARRTMIESQMAFTDNGKKVRPADQALRWSVQVRKR